jgi:hypothetical protein
MNNKILAAAAIATSASALRLETRVTADDAVDALF